MVGVDSDKSLVGAGFGIGLTIEASLGANFAGVIHREVLAGISGIAEGRISRRRTGWLE